MQIKLKDGTEIELNLKGRHRRKAWKALTGLRDSKEDTGKFADAIERLNSTFIEIACDAAGLTQEQTDDMDLDDLNKILGIIKDKCFQKLDFQTP